MRSTSAFRFALWPLKEERRRNAERAKKRKVAEHVNVSPELRLMIQTTLRNGEGAQHGSSRATGHDNSGVEVSPEVISSHAGGGSPDNFLNYGPVNETAATFLDEHRAPTTFEGLMHNRRGLFAFKMEKNLLCSPDFLVSALKPSQTRAVVGVVPMESQPIDRSHPKAAERNRVRALDSFPASN
jgi:hypothetical protein